MAGKAEENKAMEEEEERGRIIGKKGRGRRK